MAAGKKTGGRKAGTPNRVTMATRERIEKEADPVGFMVRVAKGEIIDAALLPGAADAAQSVPTIDQRMNAAKWLGERSTPAPKGRFVTFALPEIKTPEDVQAASLALLEAAAGGEITADEALAFVPLLEVHRENLAIREILDRLEKLEGGK
jgi:hypothetical protein